MTHNWHWTFEMTQMSLKKQIYSISTFSLCDAAGVNVCMERIVYK